MSQIAGGNAIGKIVSVQQGEPRGRAFALAYVRCRSKGVQIPLAGTAVLVNDATGELVEVPALQREFRPEHAPQLAAREEAQPSSDDRCDLPSLTTGLGAVYIPAKQSS